MPCFRLRSVAHCEVASDRVQVKSFSVVNGSPKVQYSQSFLRKQFVKENKLYGYFSSSSPETSEEDVSLTLEEAHYLSKYTSNVILDVKIDDQLPRVRAYEYLRQSCG